MKPHNRVFLIGPMGAGKTTVGRRLARQLKLRFVDCDQEIERRTGASISLIFDVEGEAGFRAREKRLVEELTQLDEVVLATGGGAVLDPDSRRVLGERGLVVYLHAPLDKLLARTRGDTGRPLLDTDDRAGRLQQIVEFRDPLYRETADLILDTGTLTLSDIVDRIRGALNRW